ncbi:MAG: hypothetical protein WC356_04125 [Candidatus Micrarchaeia archaeon]|jgi:hypothetical protein
MRGYTEEVSEYEKEFQFFEKIGKGMKKIVWLGVVLGGVIFGVSQIEASIKKEEISKNEPKIIEQINTIKDPKLDIFISIARNNELLAQNLPSNTIKSKDRIHN